MGRLGSNPLERSPLFNKEENETEIRQSVNTERRKSVNPSSRKSVKKSKRKDGKQEQSVKMTVRIPASLYEKWKAYQLERLRQGEKITFQDFVIDLLNRKM